MKTNTEAIFKKYIKGWLLKDKKMILDTINDDVSIEECYGPLYIGKKQVNTWLNHWFVHGEVIKWEILENWYDAQKNCSFYKWYFECSYANKVSEFNGMSIVKTDNNKITLIEEYKTTCKHEYPY